MTAKFKPPQLTRKQITEILKRRAFLKLANSGTIASPTFPIRLRYCQAYGDAMQDIRELRSQATDDQQG